MCCFFFQAEDGIRDIGVTGVQTCALPISQIWMYVSFIMIPAPQSWLRKWWFVAAGYANPLYGIVSGYRRVLIGIGPEQGWDVRYLLSSAVLTLAIFTFGLFFFRRTERRFADIA